MSVERRDAIVAAQKLIRPGHATPALDPRVKLGHPLLDDPRVFLDHALRLRLGVCATALQKDAILWIAGGPAQRILEMYRGASKSWMTGFWTTWVVWRDFVLREGHPEINVLVISADQKRADGFSLFCRELIQLIPETRCMVPDAGSRRWSGIAFDVEGAPISQTPTLASRSIMGRLTGDRADVVVPDDVEIPANSETQGQRDKLLERFGELQNVIKPGGHCVVLGTPHTEDSIYNRLIDWGFSRRIYPARYPRLDDLEGYSGDLAPYIERPLREDPRCEWTPVRDCMFDEDGLQRHEAKGRTRFAMQFMLRTDLADEDRYPLKLRDLIVTDCSPERAPERPIWSGSEKNRLEHLMNVGLTGDRWQGPAEVQADRWGPTDGCVVAVDPSGRGSDETAWCAVAAQGAWLYLLESRGDVRGYEEAVLDRIVDTCQNQRATHVICEANFGDGMFEKILERRLQARGVLVGVEGVHHHAMKENRILDTLEPVFNSHRLCVSPAVIEQDDDGIGDKRSTRYRLWYQATRMQRIKGALEHDDRVEALSMAVRYWVGRMSVDQETYVNQRQLEERREALRRFWERVPGYKPQLTPSCATNSGLRCHDA